MNYFFQLGETHRFYEVNIKCQTSDTIIVIERATILKNRIKPLQRCIFGSFECDEFDDTEYFKRQCNNVNRCEFIPQGTDIRQAHLTVRVQYHCRLPFPLLKYLVHNNATNLEYCHPQNHRTRRQPAALSVGNQLFDSMLEDVRAQARDPHNRNYEFFNLRNIPQTALTEVITQYDQQAAINIPISLSAVIRSEHTGNGPRLSIPPEVQTNLNAMGFRRRRGKIQNK